MRPLPAWPTKTFQSPKLATSAGLTAASFFSVLSGFLVAASTGAKTPRRTKAATAEATPARERKGNPVKLIDIRPRDPSGALALERRRRLLPGDRGEIP